MRIGLVIDYFDPHRGGAEHWTFQFARRLVTRGYEVHVVAQAVSPAGAALPVTGHPIGPIGSRLGRAAAAEKVLRTLELDVVHDMGCGWHCDVLQSEDGSRLAQWEQKLMTLPPWARPMKRALIRVLPRYRDFRRLIARQLEDPNRIVLAVSKMCAWDYQRFHGVPRRRIRLVYHGTDNERFSPVHRHRWRAAVRGKLGIGDEEVVYLFVGHDYVRKGLATAVRATGRLVRDGRPARLVVLGGNGPGRYGRTARRCGAHGAVAFAGRADDPVPYYAAADAFVLPTFYDPCSLSVSEAAACGLPCVTTRFNGAGELLTEGVDGYVLPDPADDAALADRMARLLDPARRERMGIAARQMALERTLERNCDEIVAVYREIRARRKAA